MQKKEIYSELLAKKLSGNATTKDLEQLERMDQENPKNALFSKKAEELWQLSKQYQEEPIVVDKVAAWKKIEGAIDSSDAKVVPMRPRRRWLRIAAMLVFVLGTYWLWNNYSSSNNEEIITQQTASQEEKVIDLPDGSKIWLNQNSQISYAANFQKRNIQLNGEAFFEVTRMENSPFTIDAGGTTTRVLGTSFNIRAYAEETNTELSVKTGKVAFKAKKSEAEARILTAGQATLYNKKEAKVAEVETTGLNDLAWQTKKLKFPSIPFSEVEKALERYYKIDIRFENPSILNCRFDGGTFQNAGLEEILDLIQIAMDFSINKENETYIISGEGCEK